MTSNQLLKYVLNCISILFLSYLGFEFFLYPTPFMDEGFYNGAILRFLDGDLFLRTIDFDKPFLQIVVHALPIWIFNKDNFLAFKVFPSIAYFLSFIFLINFINENKTKLVIIFNTLILLSLFSMPVMIYHGFSAFPESVALLTVVIGVRYVFSNNITKTFQWSLVSFLIKPTAIFWYFGDIVKRFNGFKFIRIKTTILVYLYRNKYLIALFFIFMTLSQSGLKPVQYLFAKRLSKSLPYAESLSIWYEIIRIQFVNSYLMSIFCMFFLFSIWVIVKDRILFKKYKGFVFSLFLGFLLLIILNNNKIFERYLFLILPQIYLIILMVLGVKKNPIIIGFLAVFSLFVFFNPHRTHLLGERFNPQLGRDISALLETKYSPIVHSKDLNWIMRSYNSNNANFNRYKNEQELKDLVYKFRNVVSIYGDNNNRSDHQIFEKNITAYSVKSETSKTEFIQTIQTDHGNLIDTILAALKIKGQLRDVKYTIITKTEESESPLEKSDLIEIAGFLKLGEQNIPINILTSFLIQNNELFVYFKSLKIQNFELVDLLQFRINGYTSKIQSLHYYNKSDFVVVDRISFSDDLSMTRIHFNLINAQ